MTSHVSGMSHATWDRRPVMECSRMFQNNNNKEGTARSVTSARADTAARANARMRASAKQLSDFMCFQSSCNWYRWNCSNT